MSDDERESRDRLPKLREFDGNAEDYLDADEGYQRYGECTQQPSGRGALIGRLGVIISAGWHVRSRRGG